MSDEHGMNSGVTECLKSMEIKLAAAIAALTAARAENNELRLRLRELVRIVGVVPSDPRLDERISELRDFLGE